MIVSVVVIVLSLVLVITFLLERSGRKTIAITKVAPGRKYTVVIRDDGSLARTGFIKDLPDIDVHWWTEITDISSGGDYILGLHSDGTVVKWGQFGTSAANVVDVGNWSEIVSISAGEEHAVGIRRDGTVIATGANWGGMVI